MRWNPLPMKKSVSYTHLDVYKRQAQRVDAVGVCRHQALGSVRDADAEIIKGKILSLIHI